MKPITYTYYIGLIICSLSLLVKCNPHERTRITKLETGTVLEYTITTATVTANFIDISGHVTDYGHCWSTANTPTIASNKNAVSGIAQKGEYTSYLEGLTANTKYYVRAYAIDGNLIVYGNVIEFKTSESKIITITSPVDDQIWETGVDYTIKWTDNIEENIKIELYKGGNKLPDIATSTESDGIYDWVPDKGLSNGNNYSVKIISVKDLNISGTSNYFTIAEAKTINISKPTAGATWIKGSGNLIEWTSNVTENINIELFKAGSKSRDIILNTSNDLSHTWIVPKDLTTANDYSVKITSAGNTSVWNESGKFTITESVPLVSTSTISSITVSSAKSGGEITNDCGAAITACGVCWSKTNNPTIANSKTTEDPAKTIFVSSLTDLAANTTYYARAYATNIAGTGYGVEISITTSASVVAPTVTSTSISNFGLNSATSGGNITSDGGANITSRGICWNTTGNPTTNDNKTIDGQGIGSFTSIMTGLTTNTTYYVKAYATNSAGTSYGNELNFKTLRAKTIPEITTVSISNKKQTTATSGGNITSDGGATITANGVCWNTIGTPTISDNKTSDAIGISNFTSNMTGLLANKMYYVRAYATNSEGTGYGLEISFTTLPNPVAPTVTTTAISNFMQTTATGGGNVTNDGGENVTERGICWNTTGTPTIANSKTSDGSGAGPFTSNLTGLTSNTTYYVRAYATNSIATSYGSQVDFKTTFTCGTRVTDLRDGKTYLTVQIGTQCWFAENLNVGTRINGISDQTNNAVLEKYCYGDAESSCNLYGGLYQWDEMMQYSTIEMSKGVCPTGWHVPSDYEWKTLEMSLGMSQTAANATGWRGSDEGGKLKAAGTTYWDSPNTGATNSSLFTAMPSGNRNSGGTFDGKGSMTDFWTSTLIVDTQCWYRYLDATHSTIYRIDGNRKFGTPVRCVKD